MKLKKCQISVLFLFMLSSCITFSAQLYIFNLNSTCHVLYPDITIVSIETDKGTKTIKKRLPAMQESAERDPKKAKAEKLKNAFYFDVPSVGIQAVTFQIGADLYKTDNLDIKLLSPGAELYLLCGASGGIGYVYRKSQFDDLMPVKNGAVTPKLLINVSAQERELVEKQRAEEQERAAKIREQEERAAQEQREAEERAAQKKKEEEDLAAKEKQIADREKELAEREKRLAEKEKALAEKTHQE